MTSLLLGGRPVPLRLCRSPQAKRLSLRVDQRDGSVVLVLPVHAAVSQGLAFAQSKSDWLTARLAALPAAVPFADGMTLPLQGVAHLLRHDPTGRRGVWTADGEIHVCGEAEYFARRLTDWLKRRALEEITASALPMAAKIGRPYRSIHLKDTRSRWGSCSSRGDLAFSWRLLLAPPAILDYVVAHEVAHLAQMNHSAAFWRLVAGLVDGADGCRAWLKQHGSALHRYGQA
ncbi:SprT family zinc-dependent metalloprotease [Telmatospirillum sp.]|uniref:M48 family metallopeptidase n=1 Tax=Telmatospirillum sp. TaxID=2079197 RepID=UPI002851E7BA|nr:SprT family zinc-dependent metalloprotease [Telmatospirillum sp.]MDR3437546.1 SprT family zinc-dependent metalloprotease [Telmatospirillum sp.]